MSLLFLRLNTHDPRIKQPRLQEIEIYFCKYETLNVNKIEKRVKRFFAMRFSQEGSSF